MHASTLFMLGSFQNQNSGGGKAMRWAKKYAEPESHDSDAARRFRAFVDRICFRGLIPLACSILLLLGVPAKASAAVIDINLNDFFADPSVAVAADGSSALMEEDPTLSFVLLVNDPFFGDPNVIIPGPATQLIFDYNFSEGVGEDDQFRASVFDSDTGLTPSGFEFLTADSSSGTVAFDLSGLVGSTLGLQFELSSLLNDTDIGSWVELSNVHLETPDVSVPEPAGLLLFIVALLGLAVAARLNRSQPV
jgi:hypothetical protein